MFRYEDIQGRLHEKPFRPFRIVASEGQQFDVKHPDLVLVGLRDLMIGFAAPDHPTVYDKVTRVALIHIVALEDLAVPTSSSSNGE